MTQPMHRREYASNLAGVALFAYDQWAFYRAAFAEHRGDEILAAMRSAKAAAYASVFRLVTGREPGFFGTRRAVENRAKLDIRGARVGVSKGPSFSGEPTHENSRS